MDTAIIYLLETTMSSLNKALKLLFENGHFNWNGTFEVGNKLQETYKTLTSAELQDEFVKKAAECVFEADYQLLRALNYESNAHTLIRQNILEALKLLQTAQEQFTLERTG